MSKSDQFMTDFEKRIRADQDKKTRHAIADKVDGILSRYDDDSIGVGLAEELHRIIMNCDVGFNK